MIFPLIFLISFSNLSKSDLVLLNPITVAPASANAIEQALAQGMKKEDLSWALFNSTEFLFVQ